MLGSPANVRRKACLAASASRPEPGSVIATNRLPSSSTSEKKCANSDSGSIVPPDFEETTNSVRWRSTAPWIARILAASVESSTCSRARWFRRRRHRRTSGAGPPGRARSRPCPAGRCPPVRRRATSAANSSSAPSSPSIRSAIVSQPRRLAISGVPDEIPPPQSVASSRAIRPATSSSEARASWSATAAPERVGNAGRDGEVGIAHARIVVGLGARVGFRLEYDPRSTPTTARPQPRPGARARDRGGRAGGGAAGGDGRQAGGRPGRGRRHALRAALGLDGRPRRDRRGREGRGADALQRRADRRRLPAAGRHRRRPAGGHDARGARDAERARGDRAVGTRHDVRPGAVRVHGEDGGLPRDRRPARPRPPGDRDGEADRRAQGHPGERRDGRGARPPAPRGDREGDPRGGRARAG